MNTGTLMQAKTPNEVIGVIAHETGHIIGGTWRSCGAHRPRRHQEPAATILGSD
jgi:predicted Zn-dependent protease